MGINGIMLVTIMLLLLKAPGRPEAAIDITVIPWP